MQEREDKETNSLRWPSDFWSKCQDHSMETEWSSHQMVVEKPDIHIQKDKAGPLLTKIKSNIKIKQ